MSPTSTVLLDENGQPKPRLRGVIHKYSAFIAAALGIVLIVGTVREKDDLAVASVVIYALSITGLFTSSGLYHRIPWKTARQRVTMKRLDHSMIFIFIAGTYTPFCVMGLPSPERWWILGVVWAGALAGVALKLIWPGSPRWLGTTLYIMLGWTIVVVAPTLIQNTGIAVMLLLAAGGLLYSIGGVFYALKWPEPWPGTFGHHEVFHACTAVAAVLHYIAVWILVLS